MVELNCQRRLRTWGRHRERLAPPTFPDSVYFTSRRYPGLTYNSSVIGAWTVTSAPDNRNITINTCNNSLPSRSKCTLTSKLLAYSTSLPTEKSICRFNVCNHRCGGSREPCDPIFIWGGVCVFVFTNITSPERF